MRPADLDRNREVYAPEARQGVLLLDGKIARLGEVDARRAAGLLGLELEVIDSDGCLVVPGFIDPHVHLTGGSGEEGFGSRPCCGAGSWWSGRSFSRRLEPERGAGGPGPHPGRLRHQAARAERGNCYFLRERRPEIPQSPGAAGSRGLARAPEEVRHGARAS